jgi:hypothetical protein
MVHSGKGSRHRGGPCSRRRDAVPELARAMGQAAAAAWPARLNSIAASALRRANRPARRSERSPAAAASAELGDSGPDRSTALTFPSGTSDTLTAAPPSLGHADYRRDPRADLASTMPRRSFRTSPPPRRIPNAPTSRPRTSRSRTGRVTSNRTRPTRATGRIADRGEAAPPESLPMAAPGSSHKDATKPEGGIRHGPEPRQRRTPGRSRLSGGAANGTSTGTTRAPSRRREAIC